jgi:hypothetical protein
MRLSRTAWLLGAASLATLVAAGGAQAATLTYNLSIEFSGGTPPAGPAPWLTATFDDTADAGGANSVRLPMSTAGLTGQEFVDQWAFNLNPGIDVENLTFATVGTPSAQLTSIQTDVDGHKADGDGYFDILFDWQNGPPGVRFGAGQTFVVDITNTAGALTVADFDFLSAPGDSQNSPGPFTTAAHVQAIGTAAEGSGWIAPGSNGETPVPEPATLSLLGLGLLGLGLAGRRRRS